MSVWHRMKRNGASLVLGTAGGLAVLVIWFMLAIRAIPVVHGFRGFWFLKIVLFTMISSSLLVGLWVYEYFEKRWWRGADRENLPPRTELKVGVLNEAIRCPECDSPMVKRIAKRGSSSGSFFFGCSNFPRCKATRSIEDAIWHPRS